ncbi:MAG: hypothetical protein JSW71_12205 [Gemmatimonadota bacterium]|nr:MAG: hypothetical protein JSW71_12205 [Gemmatimonadota bacterium]
MLLFVAVCFAVLFHRVAYHEHMSGWAWSVASLALSGVVMLLLPGLTALILAQVALFGVLWWANTRRLAARGQHLVRAREEERRLRRERVERARGEIRRERERSQ